MKTDDGQNETSLVSTDSDALITGRDALNDAEAAYDAIASVLKELERGGRRALDIIRNRDDGDIPPALRVEVVDLVERIRLLQLDAGSHRYEKMSALLKLPEHERAKRRKSWEQYAAKQKAIIAKKKQEGR
jgi:hypothetical protein